MPGNHSFTSPALIIFSVFMCINVCMSACLYACVFVYMQIYTYLCKGMWKPEVIVGYLPLLFSTILFKVHSSSVWGGMHIPWCMWRSEQVWGVIFFFPRVSHESNSSHWAYTGERLYMLSHLTDPPPGVLKQGLFTHP